jgi:hypothetical protein
MKIETMWCVDDPGPLSELADICFEADPRKPVHVISGTLASGSVEYMRRMDALAIYTDETEARADAKRRLAERDARVDASTSTSAYRVWELFDGHVRLFESGDMMYWNAQDGRWHDGWGSWGSSPIVRIDEVRYEEWQVAVEAYLAAGPYSKSTGP